MCLQSDLHRLIIGQRSALLPFHRVERVTTREPAHLFEPFNRHERSERFAFPLDDEFVMAQRHTIQQITNPLPHVDRRNAVSHASPATSIVARVQETVQADRMDDSSI